MLNRNRQIFSDGFVFKSCFVNPKTLPHSSLVIKKTDYTASQNQFLSDFRDRRKPEFHHQE
jgi:hypothetical protein